MRGTVGDGAGADLGTIGRDAAGDGEVVIYGTHQAQSFSIFHNFDLRVANGHTRDPLLSASDLANHIVKLLRSFSNIFHRDALVVAMHPSALFRGRIDRRPTVTDYS